MILQVVTLKIAIIVLILYILIFVGNLFIIIAGIRNFKDSYKIKTSHLFTITGSLNIFWILFYPSIVGFIYTVNRIDYSHFDLINWIFGNIATGLLFLITLGVYFIVIGYKNKRERGFLLILSGILRIISSVLLISSSIILDSSLYLNIPTTNQFIRLIMNILYYFGIIFELTSISLLFVYSIEKVKKSLCFSAMLFIFGSLLTFIINLYQSTHHIFLV